MSNVGSIRGGDILQKGAGTRADGANPRVLRLWSLRTMRHHRCAFNRSVAYIITGMNINISSFIALCSIGFRYSKLYKY